MSRVIGGSTSTQAYSRMLDEIKQKRDDQKAENARNTNNVRAYEDTTKTGSQDTPSGHSYAKNRPGIDTYA